VDTALKGRLAIDPSEASFANRGFRATPAQAILEAAASAFITGYNRVVASDQAREFLDFITAFPPHLRGFAAEGGATASALRQVLLPWRRSLEPLLAVLEPRYVHLAHVGVGWTIAKLPIAYRYLVRHLDPSLAPLALDGMGFHDGYFGWHRRWIGRGWRPVYDQGLGRSLWFACGADPMAITEVIGRTARARHADLWAGIGLACVYAGGSDEAGVETLLAGAGPAAKWLRQGAAFGIAAHARAGLVPEFTASRSLQICQRAADAVAELVERERVTGRAGPQPFEYQEWRARVAAALEPV
jgi:hypothetical protein